RLIATIRNTGTATAQAHVQVDVHDSQNADSSTRVAGETTVPVGGGQTASASFPVPAGRWASVRVDDAVGAAADNVRYLLLGPTARPTVLVITTAGDLAREAFYLEQALVAAGVDGRAYGVEGAAAGDLATWDQSRLDAHTAVILLSTRALEHHGRQLLTSFLASGGGLIVAAGPDVDGEVLQEVLNGPRLSIVSPGVSVPGSRVAHVDLRICVIRSFARSARRRARSG
ncbi:MAG: hypothetical protein QM736_12450, partial [Vicinamibacterales bacterium]